LSKRSEVTIAAARKAADYLEANGQPKMAEDVRRLCRSNSSFRTTLQTLHRDNMELREGRTLCACPLATVERVTKEHGTCGNGGCPYGGDF
jgi:hypothetical protein